MTLENYYASIEERNRELESQIADLIEERNCLLRDWNDLVRVSGSKTNGGAIGHVQRLRSDNEKLIAAGKRLKSLLFYVLGNAWAYQSSLEMIEKERNLSDRIKNAIDDWNEIVGNSEEER